MGNVLCDAHPCSACARHREGRLRDARETLGSVSRPAWEFRDADGKREIAHSDATCYKAECDGKVVSLPIHTMPPLGSRVRVRHGPSEPIVYDVKPSRKFVGDLPPSPSSALPPHDCLALPPFLLPPAAHVWSMGSSNSICKLPPQASHCIVSQPSP